MTDLHTENARLRAALEACVNMLDDLVAESGRGIEYGEEDAFRMGEWFDDHELRDIDTARAALAAPAPDAPDLTDPTVIHANMLRGTIAKPTVAQIIHIYGSAVFLELLYKRGLCKPTVAPAPDAVQEAARVLLAACPNPLFDMLKPIIMGEVTESVGYTDDVGNERFYNRNVSWTAMKEIIRVALRAIAGDRT